MYLEGKSPTSRPTAAATCFVRPPPEKETELKELQQPDASLVETEPKRRDTDTAVKTGCGWETSPKSTYVEQSAEISATRPLQARQNLSSDVEVDCSEQVSLIDLKSGPPMMACPSTGSSVVEPSSAVASSAASSYRPTFSPSSVSGPPAPRVKRASHPGGLFISTERCSFECTVF